MSISTGCGCSCGCKGLTERRRVVTILPPRTNYTNNENYPMRFPYSLAWLLMAIAIFGLMGCSTEEAATPPPITEGYATLDVASVTARLEERDNENCVIIQDPAAEGEVSGCNPPEVPLTPLAYTTVTENGEIHFIVADPTGRATILQATVAGTPYEIPFVERGDFRMVAVAFPDAPSAYAILDDQNNQLFPITAE